MQSSDDKGTKSSKGEAFLKLMRIQAVKPTSKSPEKSFREMELAKIEKTAPLIQPRRKNETETSISKDQLR